MKQIRAKKTNHRFQIICARIKNIRYKLVGDAHKRRSFTVHSK